MAFLQNGSWVPDQPMNAQGNMQGMRPMQPAGNPQIAPQLSQAQMMPQMPIYGSGGQIPTSFSYHGGGGSGGGPVVSGHSGMSPSQSIGQSQASMPSPQQQMTATQASFNPPQMPEFPQQFVQQAPVQSQMQQVAHNPQAVQNFLQSLGQNKSQTNAWQNPAGMQGQGPQAGFRGFQQNGVPMYQQQAAQFQAQNSQLGSYANQASGGNQVTPGGTGGVAGQPQFNVPSNPTHALHYNPAQYQGPRTYEAPRVVNKEGSYAPTQKQQDIENYGKSGRQGESGPNNSDWGAYSDVNVKQNIESGDAQLQDFLNSLNAYSYEYIDPKYGEGRRISPMAQEIEKTPLGKAAISTSPEGYKMVDYGKLGGTMLASLALLNHKYEELESKLKKSIMAGLKSKGKN